MTRALAALLSLGIASGQDPRYHLWQEEVELELLLRACSLHLGVPIDFDRSQVQGTISVEAPDGLTFDALWALTNRRLVDAGLACVQLPGDDSLTVVPLDQASGLARIEYGTVTGSKAGYVKAIHLAEHADPRELEQSLSALLPKGGSRVTTLAGTRHLLIAGLTPQVAEALAALRVLDSGPEQVSIREIEPRHVSAGALAAQLEQLVQAREAAGAEKLKGRAIASPARGSILLVSPRSEEALWSEWIERFDRADAVLTRTYVPTRFGLEETARLIERVAGSPPGWRLVRDELTGSLLITAPSGVHERIETLFHRLEAADLGPRRELRSFPVTHRDAQELIELLGELIEEEGMPRAIEEAAAESRASPRTAGAPRSLTLTADRGTNRVLAYGETHLLDQLQALIEELDARHPQVLVEVLAVGLSESEMRELGVELRYAAGGGGTLAEAASLFGLGSPAVGETAIPAPAGSGATGVVLDPGRFSAVLRALETVAGGRTLTIPKVLVSNHQDARLDSVLQPPYLSTAATNTVATTALGGTSDAGTSITVTPHILDADRLRLDYSISISSFVGESADPALPPPRQQNLLTSTAVVPDGYTVVAGGVEVESGSAASSRVPLLGDLPLLGALFRSDSQSRTRTRHFVFLRCNILRGGFEELRHLSREAGQRAGIPGDDPILSPRVIR